MVGALTLTSLELDGLNQNLSIDVEPPCPFAMLSF